MLFSRIVSNLFEDSERKIARVRYLICYTSLTLILLISTFIVSSDPCLYRQLSAIFTAILFIPRIILFIKKGWFLYLLDYSYVINVAMIYFIQFDSTPLTNSLLLASSYFLIIDAFRYGSSLCVHSVEVFTNCYLHINPAILMTSSFLGGCIEFNKSFEDILFYSLLIFSSYGITYTILVYILLRPIWTKYRLPNIYAYHQESPIYQSLFNALPSWGVPIVLFGIHLHAKIMATIFIYYGLKYPIMLSSTCFIFVPYTIYRAGTYYIDYLPAKAVELSIKAPGS
jgi:hypothetical protein